MTYDEAMDDATTVSVADAIRELRRHDCEKWELQDRIGKRCFVDLSTGETFATVDDSGEVYSADILGWLGY